MMEHISIQIDGPPGSKTQSNAAFDTANGFFEAAVRCATPIRNPYNSDAIMCPMPPALTMAAFASELYMKSIIMEKTDSKITGHRLDRLYSQLPRSAQSSINSYFANFVGISRIKVRPEIGRLANAFVDWRYVFERKMDISPHSLFSLSKALYLTARSECPDWAVDQYLHERIISDFESPILHIANLDGGHMVRVTRSPS